MTPFWRFWTASAISHLGSSVTAVALPLAALFLLNANAFEVGLIAGASYLGWALLGLPAGVICQFLPLRGVQVITDVLRGLAIMSVPISWSLQTLTVVQLVVVALLISLCNVLFDVSNSTFLPAIVEPEELNKRNSWLSGLDATTQLAGPSGAGILIQLIGPAYALTIDAVSYFVSAVILRTLPPRTQPRPDEPPRLMSMIKTGWSFVVRQPVMRACLLDATASNFVAGAFLVLVPVYLVRELDASPFIVGLVLAAEGFGGLLGAVLAPRVSARLGSAQATLVGSLLASVLVILLVVARGPVGIVLFAVGTMGFAAGGVVTSITTRTYRQLASPPELLSRVMATVRFVSWGVIPIGSFLAGLAASTIGNWTTLLAACLLSWLSPIVLLLSPVRTLRELDPRMATTTS